MNQIKNLSSKKIASNSILNVFGQILPLGIGFYTIPKLIKILGPEKFSLLTIVWLALGYFSFFDLGLGRAIIKVIADKIGENKRNEIPEIFWSSMFLMTVLSLIGAILGYFIGPLLVVKFMSINTNLIEETISAVKILALSIPLVTLSAGVRGVLEAEHKFTTINVLQVLLGAYTYLSPLLIKSGSLVDLILLLVIGRVVSFILHIYFVFRDFPDLKKMRWIKKKHIPELINLGSWMTVSNIIGPIMVYFDRFFLSAMVPMAQVAFYTTPYEVISRLLIIPSALVRVLFPALSTAKSFDSKHFHGLYKKSFLVNIFLLAIPTVLFLVFSHLGLKLWLGEDFADKSYFILQILAVGVFVNGIAWVPFTLIQSAGRADLTAKAHLFELPFYLISLYFLIKNYAVTGAAIAWSSRVLIDMLIMNYLAKKVLR